MAHLKVKPDASSREEGGNDYHSSSRCLLRQRLLLDTEDCFKLGTKDTSVSLNEKLDALSRDYTKDHHFYNRSFLRQKLVLDTEDCFKLGTKSIALSTPKRNKKPCTCFSHRLYKEYKETAKNHFLLGAMHESRKPLKGNMYSKVNTHLEIYKRGPSMMHSINEEPPRKQLKEDVTTHRNFGSVSKDLKRKQSFEVNEPSGGYQSASPRPILRSFRCTPEWTPTANDSHKGPAIKKFRKCVPEFLQWHQACGEPLKSTVRPLAGSHPYPPEESKPFPYWAQPEIEELKKLAQQEREEAA